MDHSGAYLNSGREAIKHEPPHPALENRNQIRKIVKILRCTMNCRSKLPFERTGNLKDLIPLRMAYEERGWTKDLRIEVRT